MNVDSGKPAELLLDGSPPSRSPGNGPADSLELLAEAWIRTNKNKKPSVHTVRAWRVDLVGVSSLLASRLGHRDDAPPLSVLTASDLTYENLEEAFADFADSHAVRSTWRARSTWNSFCGWLISRKVLATNPLLEVKKPKRAQSKPKALDEKALARVLAVALDYRPPRGAGWPELDAALACVLIGAGLRAAEVLALTREDLHNWSGGLPELEVTGKGNKTRTLAFPPEMAARLVAYLGDRDRRFGRCKPSEKMFVGPNGNPLTYGALAWRVEQWGKLAGVTITPHVFRHTYATALLQNGADLVEIQRLLGHADISTTQQYQDVGHARLQAAAMANPARHMIAGDSASRIR